MSAIKVYSDRGTQTEYGAKTVSTALEQLALVDFSSGYLAASTSSTTTATIAGVGTKAVASTDDDYAVATKIPFYPASDKSMILEMDVTGASLAQANVGESYDLSDAQTVDLSATSLKVVKCVGVISTTRGLFKIN